MEAAEMLSAIRTPDGRFAPGQSGNPAGRPKGSKGLGRRLVEALHEGEDETILRHVIDAALDGDKTAARFCAARIDGAARRRADLPQLDIAPADALNPFLVHARLVQAMLAGDVAPEAALAALRVLGAKRHLDAYKYFELDLPELRTKPARPINMEIGAEDAEDEDDEEDGFLDEDEEDEFLEDDEEDDEPAADDARPEDATRPMAADDAGLASSGRTAPPAGTAPAPEPALSPDSDPPPAETPAPVAAPEGAAEAPAASAPADEKVPEPVLVRRIPRYVWVPEGYPLWER